MDFFGDYDVNSEVVSPEIQTLTEKKTTTEVSTKVSTTIVTTTKNNLIPLDEREKEILIFSLFGIILILGILLTICFCKKRRNRIDFEMERLNAGSSTTLFDKNR